MTMHIPKAVLEAGLPLLREAPRDHGRLDMIVRRPAVDAREVLTVGELDPEEGLVGDCWRARGSKKTPDGAALADAQIAIMGTRTLSLIAPDRAHWPLAGDQLIVDLDLSEAHLPAGTLLQIGEARLVVTPEPHNGCAKFLARYGKDALAFIGSPDGKALRLRGIYARVLTPGTIRVGEIVKVEA